MELLIPHHYAHHILRMPPDQWPDPVNRALLVNWDRTADLGRIAVPTLVIGARHDTMDPKHMEVMAGKVQKGRYLYCPNGSHMELYDDQKVYTRIRCCVSSSKTLLMPA